MWTELKAIVCTFVISMCVKFHWWVFVPRGSQLIPPFISQVQYPQGIKTGHLTFAHIHDKDERPRDQNKYFNQKDVSEANCVHYVYIDYVSALISGN